jgi:hypothetical protein
MPFQKGNKLSPGGKKGNRGGRPSKQKAQIKRQAAEIAKAYIEKNVQPIIETYVALAAGKVVTRMTDDGKKEFELKVNPRITADAVGKFLPPAKQDVEHSGLILHELKTNIPSEDEEEERIRSARLVQPSES